jgi:major membrane immunogen (membrane-anchored lipoprotein)
MRNVVEMMVVGLLLAGCGRRDDAEIQDKLTGTWVFDFGNGVQSTVVQHQDGSYRTHITGFTDGSVHILEGTMLAKDGVLIDTITNDNRTNEPVPRSSRVRIVRLNDHEMVLRWDSMQSDSVARKVK